MIAAFTLASISGSDAMYIAVFMGPFARGPRDDRPLINYCLEGAVRAAADGFSLVTFGEQHFNNYEPYCNPLMMGARLSPFLGETYFGTSMCPLPYHNPIMMAENINVLDQLLEGRLIVGLSAGRVGFSPDFENFGLDPAHQRAIYAEKYDALMRLWGHRPDDGPLRFDGKWVKGGMHGRLMPSSYRAPHPHIMIGTNTDETCRRAGVEGNILSLGPCTLEDAANKFRLFRDGLDEAGYEDAFKSERLVKSMVHHQVVVASSDDQAWADAETMGGRNPMLRRDQDGRSMRQMFEDGVAGRTDLNPMEAANSRFVQAWFIVGSPDSVTEQLLAHKRAGIAQVLTRFTVGVYNPPMWDASYGLFVEQCMPNLAPERFNPPSEVRAAVAAGPLPIGPSGSFGAPGTGMPNLQPARS
ncbi:LLM class flavin-dependent oxidoreductase (plasmid) [Novosphingobium sp. BL-8A]|uniref:LLM class flavin-dependent oxidoreductase n=1 Tax=Novosphingobium sp. BL-8A TaxID=3127639 RepID=UPI0037567888